VGETRNDRQFMYFPQGGEEGRGPFLSTRRRVIRKERTCAVRSLGGGRRTKARL